MQGHLEETAQVYIWLVSSISIASLGNLYQCLLILTEKKPQTKQANKHKIINKPNPLISYI